VAFSLMEAVKPRLPVTRREDPEKADGMAHMPSVFAG
jgi:hypothetical protein